MSVPICPFVNQVGIRCGQPEGHPWGHGNGLLTTPRDRWHLPSAEPSPFSPSPPSQAELAKQWTLREGDRQCLWQGLHGRCILRAGHFPQVGHEEMGPEKLKV